MPGSEGRSGLFVFFPLQLPPPALSLPEVCRLPGGQPRRIPSLPCSSANITPPLRLTTPHHWGASLWLQQGMNRAIIQGNVYIPGLSQLTRQVL